MAVHAAEKCLDVYKTCLGDEAEKTMNAEKSLRAFRADLEGSSRKRVEAVGKLGKKVG